MSRSRFRPDRGLVARMSLTLFLIGALYVAVVAVLIAAHVQIGFILVIAAILLFSQYFFSDKMALYGMGGRIVTPEEAPELHGIVDRLCALADMPKPRVAIADTDMPNAFATGRNPSHAVVCATTGIMRRLDTEELEGVLAHELSHVAHRDVAVMTFASFLGMVAGLITRFAFYSGLFGGFDEEDNNNGGAGAIVVIMLVSILVYAVSFLLTRSLSRYRELSAARAPCSPGSRRRWRRRCRRSAASRRGSPVATCAAPRLSTPSSSPPRSPRASRSPRCSRPTPRWRSGSSSSRGSRCNSASRSAEVAPT
jgi:heat shock protein HtpX